MIALICGPDALTARTHVASLLARHDPDGSTTSRLDGRTVSLGQVIADVGSAGFFGTPRVVVVSDLMTRAGRGSTKGEVDEEETTTAASLDLGPLFNAVPPVNLLVLVDQTLGAVPAAIKRAAPSDAVILLGDPPRGGDLKRWLIETAQQAGSEIKPKAADALLRALYPQSWSTKPVNPRFDRPPDLDRLRHEVAKLAVAAYPGPITVETIDEMVAAGPDDRVFRFVEAADAGQLAAALGELSRLQDAGEEPAKLSAQLLQQLELGTIVEAQGAPRDPAAAGRELGLANPNRMVGIATARRSRSSRRSEIAVSSAVVIDRAAKRGELRQPEDALYALIQAAGSTDAPGDATSVGGS